MQINVPEWVGEYLRFVGVAAAFVVVVSLLISFASIVSSFVISTLLGSLAGGIILGTIIYVFKFLVENCD